MTKASKDTAEQNPLGLFHFHGLPNIPAVNGQVVVDCPFCEKEAHFFISAVDGRWDCKVCGLAGNAYTFLQLYYEHWEAATTDKQFKELAKFRKVPKLWEAFRADGWAYDGNLERWLVPVRNDTGSMVDLQVYDLAQKPKPRLYHTKGCTQHLEGLDCLAPEGPIFLCEGRFDKTLLDYLFPKIDQREAYTILSLPGCTSYGSLKKDAKLHFRNRDIVVLLDSGTDKKPKRGESPRQIICDILSTQCCARNISFLQWPESYLDNYDISDLIVSKGPEKAWGLITSFLQPYIDPRGVAHHTAEIIAQASTEPATFKDVITTFRKSGVHITQHFSDAIATTLATIISVKLGGKPIWLFLIGPPGCGKSLILDATLSSALCEYQSDMKYETMLSGYAGGGDPSLLARLGNRALVVKDYTTILDKGQQQQQELLALMREAYDGRIVRRYGNHICRSYPPPNSGLDFWYFSFVAGCTPQIHKHVKAAMGEAQRFLKIEMRPVVKSIELIRRAINNVEESWQEAHKSIQRQQVMRQFLDNIQVNPEKLPLITKNWQEEIVWLTQFVCISRAHIERDRSTEDLLYAATTESGTRLAEQLAKISQCLAIVIGGNRITDEVKRIVRRVAWDTAFGWCRQTLAALAHAQDSYIHHTEISKRSRLSVSTARRMLRDLRDLGIVITQTATSNGGRPAETWKLSALGQEIIHKVRIPTLDI